MGEIFPEHPVSPVIPQDGEIQAEIPPLLQGKEPKAPPWAEVEPDSWGRGTPGETLLLEQLCYSPSFFQKLSRANQWFSCPGGCGGGHSLVCKVCCLELVCFGLGERFSFIYT